ncbi:unnamed protein product [Paramecium sonneborni]|uniref:HIT domain-containing protein n=1 Tax=Paramecium sonneborni TaxID=65129 RepID=A0A8S1K1F0_9CILI|nr:unnamed protein product [Paramecium sonneborni]
MRSICYSFSTIFDKIIKRQIPAKIIYEDKHCLAFEDINPKAKIHVLVIPKEHLDRLSNATEQHINLLGNLMYAVNRVGRQLQLEGYRVVINDGQKGGQTVFHLHAHILSGENLPGFE